MELPPSAPVGTPADNAFGVPMRVMKAKAKTIGKDHGPASGSWEHGTYEARTSFAWEKVSAWAPDPREFVRRAGFALIWALSRHDGAADDAAFTGRFDLFREAARDERSPVRKAVDMALRATGKRNAARNAFARQLAEELAGSESESARRIGTHARRELESAKVLAMLERRR